MKAGRSLQERECFPSLSETAPPHLPLYEHHNIGRCCAGTVMSKLPIRRCLIQWPDWREDSTETRHHKGRLIGSDWYVPDFQVSNQWSQVTSMTLPVKYSEPFDTCNWLVFVHYAPITHLTKMNKSKPEQLHDWWSPSAWGKSTQAKVEASNKSEMLLGEQNVHSPICQGQQSGLKKYQTFLTGVTLPLWTSSAHMIQVARSLPGSYFYVTPACWAEM